MHPRHDAVTSSSTSSSTEAPAPTSPLLDTTGLDAEIPTITEDGLVAEGVLPEHALAAPTPEIPSPHGVTVERAFGFVDLCGFTAFTATEGPEAAFAALRHFRELVRAVAATRGVRIAKWLGDGCMLVGVSPGPVVATLAELMVRFPAPLRGGAAAGAVLLFEADDHIGEAVNLAARLCALAEPDELWVAPAVLAYLPDWTNAQLVEPVEVRSLGRVEGLAKVTVNKSLRQRMDAPPLPAAAAALEE